MYNVFKEKIMENKVEILGVNIDKLTVKSASEKIYSYL